MNRQNLFYVSLVFCVTFLLPGTPADAGHIVGNGGDVVVCPDKKPEVQLLDIYEGQLEGFTPVLGADKQSLESKIEFALQRLAKIDPERAAMYRQEISRFWVEVSWLKNIHLDDLDDSHHLFIPGGCHIEQVAIQDAPKPNSYLFYIINQDNFDKLDDDNKVGLIFHEVILKEALQFGHLDSRLARIFNFHLLSEEFDSIEISKYQDLLKKVNFTKFSGVDFNRYFTKREVDDWPSEGKKLIRDIKCNPQPMLPGSSDVTISTSTTIFINRLRDPYYFVDPLHIPWVFISNGTQQGCFIKALRENF